MKEIIYADYAVGEINYEVDGHMGEIKVDIKIKGVIELKPNAIDDLKEELEKVLSKYFI